MGEKDKVEFEDVMIKVPKVLMRFLRDIEKHWDMTVKEYLEYSVICAFAADFDTLEVFMPEPKNQVKHYGLAVLNEVVEDAIPSYFIEHC